MRSLGQFLSFKSLAPRKRPYGWRTIQIEIPYFRRTISPPKQHYVFMRISQ
jgi:hypothetical protein